MGGRGQIEIEPIKAGTERSSFIGEATGMALDSQPIVFKGSNSQEQLAALYICCIILSVEK